MYNLLLVDDEPLIKVAFQSAVEWGKNSFCWRQQPVMGRKRCTL